ncbi:NinE family protein [Atlantibacter hermannii]|uniref:NinE family protein n=1 Tax=Atlantibacter hermannii TaxID=565 RepID=UPI0028B0E2E1|nr:NinE family protein [Atlantibacter hermannii]
MNRRRSITQIAMDNMIFRVTHRKKRKPEPTPSQIPSFAHSSHLQDIKWMRERARRRYVKTKNAQ